MTRNFNFVLFYCTVQNHWKEFQVGPYQTSDLVLRTLYLAWALQRWMVRPWTAPIPYFVQLRLGKRTAESRFVSLHESVFFLNLESELWVICPFQLLDINEQPIGYGRDAKRRRKLPGETICLFYQLTIFFALREFAKSRKKFMVINWKSCCGFAAQVSAASMVKNWGKPFSDLCQLLPLEMFLSPCISSVYSGCVSQT